MDFKAILEMGMKALPWLSYVLMGLGSLVLLGYAYVKATPTQDDDAWYAKVEAMAVVGPLMKALVSFSPLQRKDTLIDKK